MYRSMVRLRAHALSLNSNACSCAIYRSMVLLGAHALSLNGTAACSCANAQWYSCLIMRYVSLDGTAAGSCAIAKWLCCVFMRYRSMVLLRAHALSLNSRGRTLRVPARNGYPPNLGARTLPYPPGNANLTPRYPVFVWEYFSLLHCDEA